MKTRDKIPPQATEIEEVVLGAILIDYQAMDEVAELLHSDMFYLPAHQKIFDAILALYNEGKPIDLMTVTQQLRKSNHLDIIGGAYYLTQMTERVVSSANLEYHSRIISEKYIQRELINTCSQTIEACYDESNDVFDIIGMSEVQRDHLLDTIVVKKEKDNGRLFEETYRNIVALKDASGGVTGVPTGFVDLDKVTAGWQKSDLIIVAARPAMGKTSFVLCCALNAAIKNNMPVAFFSLEMSAEQLMKRQIAIHREIDLNKFRRNLFDSHDIKQIESARTELSNAPIYWDDTPSISVTELRAKARKMHRQYGIKMICIDYLQLMVSGSKSKAASREQEISYISRSLKALAKELDIPIIALSQLSRAVESRQGNAKRPMLSDLRESGAIEQDADLVIFLYRPEYYDIQEDESGLPTNGKAEILIAKHRNGATDDVELKFAGKYTKFYDMDPFGGRDDNANIF